MAFRANYDIDPDIVLSLDRDNGRVKATDDEVHDFILSFLRTKNDKVEICMDDSELSLAGIRNAFERVIKRKSLDDLVKFKERGKRPYLVRRRSKK